MKKILILAMGLAAFLLSTFRSPAPAILPPLPGTTASAGSPTSFLYYPSNSLVTQPGTFRLNVPEFPNTPVATTNVSSLTNLIRAVNTAAAGATVGIAAGTYRLGTNQLIIPDNVNVVGIGSSKVVLIGHADCAGVEGGRMATGGPQVHPGNNSIVQGLAVQCDTNAMIAMLTTNGHSGTWSAFGVSYLNPPAHKSFTNVLVRDVRGLDGYFDVFHHNPSNRCEVRYEYCWAEAQGGTWNFVSAITTGGGRTPMTNAVFTLDHCVGIAHGNFPSLIVDNFANQSPSLFYTDCEINARNFWGLVSSSGNAFASEGNDALIRIEDGTVYSSVSGDNSHLAPFITGKFSFNKTNFHGYNGITFSTNTPAYWPTRAEVPGGSFLGKSNHVLYLLTSTPGSTTWAATNKLGP